MSNLSLSKLRRREPPENPKPKKKLDRFDGLSEEDLQKSTLPDILKENLDLVFVGINPSLTAAHRGRYYAGPGNHFYGLLFQSELVPELLTFQEDDQLLHHKIGLTNIVSRPTRSSSEIKKSEIKEGVPAILTKIQRFKPKIAVFNGKCIYEVFAGVTGKANVNLGLQPEKIEDTSIWVVPSSSARCANFPRMTDKLQFYLALKKYLSFLKGEVLDVNLDEFRFEGKCNPAIPSTSKMWRRKNVSNFLHGGRIANKDTFVLDEEDFAVASSTEFVLSQESKEESKEITNETDNSITEKDESSSKENIKITEEKPEKCLQPRSQRRQKSEDFFEIIKQRVLEKETVSRSKSEVQKLNFSNLKTNRNGKKFASFSLVEGNDKLNDSGFYL